ncbi:hypothetical protein [Rhizosaccharibacter radicis]|uniref:Uncharacterized protein n=1 Tax=Rhizosaccharibacter radicis TaxID=2782605 RepID=A0ABT1VTV4_9PROT|nr:hypothetical protein [Acetobacteraceae bacterium KSS12]
MLVDDGFRDILADDVEAGIRPRGKIEQDMVASRVRSGSRGAVAAIPACPARHASAAKRPAPYGATAASTTTCRLRAPSVPWRFEHGEGSWSGARPTG